MSALGKFLHRQTANRGLWFKLYLGALALLVALNFLFRPEHPHFGLDAYPLFWPVFGLGVGLVMVLVVKKIIQPLIVRNEDFYHDR